MELLEITFRVSALPSPSKSNSTLLCTVSKWENVEVDLNLNKKKILIKIKIIAIDIIKIVLFSVR